MKHLKYPILLLLLFALANAKSKPKDWQTGTLIDVTIEKGRRLVGSMSGSNGNVNGVIVHKRDDATYYHIDGGDIFYVAKRTLTQRHDKQLKVTINARVKYAIVGDDFYIQDEDGKEHKLSIEEKRAKQKPQ